MVSRQLTRLVLCALCLAATSANAQIVNPRPSLAGLLHCLDGRTTLVSGHRGGVEPGYPENALETFTNTLSQAQMLLETDVRTTKDGVLILMHDADVGRTTTGTGAVADLTWDEITLLRLRDNDGRETTFRAPRLDAALDWARGRGVLILDIKEDSSVEAIARAVAAARAQPFAGMIAYNADQAERVFQVDPSITVFYPAETADALAALTARGVALDNVVAFVGIERTAPQDWRGLKARGLPVAFGTLFFTDQAIAMSGGDAHFAYLHRLGVDVVATDRHHQAFAAIDRVANVRDALRECGADDD